ncbi:MAG: gamma-glutamyltransferase [Vicinamibacterales bacterium]|jgi:gamma-glutamyltranspeptidase/glutathione hydrolase|nr:gamma-glutamyltransferase [Vicinamibacterales bacterium]MDP6608362.1 gamma-glutamyltransferase [Vicinamibacterales bacterium]|tara:strand:- start:1640 stop:3331 length:1692 start_codon:yes stop_codon:yes gene_type:complete
MRRLSFVVVLLAAAAVALVQAGNQPIRARNGMVVSQNAIASQVGIDALEDGGTAIDAAVATAFALAVTHPTAGNIGGGGFLVHREASGDAIAYDFRELAPAGASATMWFEDDEYSFQRHHMSHLSVGVPGTVAGLYLAWEEHGTLPWRRLVDPAIALARDGFPVTHALAASLERAVQRMSQHPASVAQFSKDGVPYEAGETLVQPDLARTLERIADQGPAGFYAGETARLIADEMRANGGLITEADLANYEAKKREPIRGTYRGYENISMPPPSSGGIVLVQMLNVLEDYDLASFGFRSARTVHLITEVMRRGYADRALHLGDPDFNTDMPIDRLTSKAYAAEQRASIDMARASVSSPTSFTWPAESPETTHFSVVDRDRNAVSLTYTLEFGYGSGIVVPGAGFLLNNEMGDFNAGPDTTNADGLIGTEPNLAAPGKRMLSSMTPTIVARDGQLFMVTGSPGGRTIINTVLHTILNVVDFGMNIQEAVDAPRFHHQWLPDRINYERHGLSPDTTALLESRGHALREVGGQGVAEAILNNAENGLLEAALDGRAADGGAVGTDR